MSAATEATDGPGLGSIASPASSAPFRLADGVANPLVAAAVGPIARITEEVLGLAELNRLYGKLAADGRPFSERALDALGVHYDVTDGDLRRIPQDGPVVLVANHPFGAVDGLVLTALMQRVRPDVKLLGNYLLTRIPDLRSIVLPVDPFGTRSGASRNAAVIRLALRWLREGGALVVFPAGEVSHVETRDGQVVDPPWRATAARLIQLTGASAVPVFFPGANSAAFRLAGRVHPRLRTALLPRELLKRRHRTVALRIGLPISPRRLAQLADPGQVTTYLRLRTYALADTTASDSARSTSADAIAAPVDSEAIAREIAALPSSQTLLESGSLSVCFGRASELQSTLLEIGRLREVTFRAAGEGTGRAIDVDTFDRDYLHLFVWNHQRREIVGAYRVGATDEIVPRRGVAGLYTSTLFRYDERLLSEIEPALELGRAFVRAEYQRDYSPLLLLWRGVATFVARNPRYRILFGPVSISNEYHSLSRQILARFLHTTSYRADLARHVTPRNPPAFLRQRDGREPILKHVVRSVAEVGALLSEIERDQKGVPVLLRQYLKLNARLLGFNVDPTFGNALDGLMLVDLTEVDRPVLARYMGRAESDTFLGHHGSADRRLAS